MDIQPSQYAADQALVVEHRAFSGASIHGKGIGHQEVAFIGNPDALAFQAIARNRISFCVNGEREQPELATVVITGDATNDDAILMHAQADSLDPLAIDTWCRLSVAKEFGKVQHTVLAEGC